MSVAAPPRGPAAGAGLVDARPMRNPDLTSPAVMTRRAWWLVVLNVLLPGSAQVLAGSRRLGRFGLGATLVLWLLVVVGIGIALTSRSLLFTLGANWFFLLILQILLVGYALLWIVLTLDTLRLTRLVRVRPLARIAVAIVSVLLLVLTAGGALYASTLVSKTRESITSVFGDGPVVPPSNGYYNVLLLGADSGPDRDSMRYDSISVVSVNADTGQVTITGIPRDLGGFPFAPGPMQDLYPEGFEGHGDPTCGWTSGINQLTNAVQACREDGGTSLYPNAVADGSTPAIEATKDAAEGILGIEIPYYVFIDMKGFADLVDALGGVTITVDERLPKGGGPAYDGQPAEDWAIGWIETGTQLMDGDTAQWYARSRYTTSDWDRMERQRELQQAILAQFTPTNVLTRFNEVMDAGTDLVSTDIPSGLVSTFLDLALKAKDQPVNTIELTPESGVDEYDPDYEQIRLMVEAVLHPATETPAE